MEPVIRLLQDLVRVLPVDPREIRPSAATGGARSNSSSRARN